MHGHENVALILIKYNCDINYGNPPPITIAASLGRKEALQAMIEKGVNLNAQDSDIYI